MFVGLKNYKLRKLNISSWVEYLCKRLELRCEYTLYNFLSEVVIRKYWYD